MKDWTDEERKLFEESRLLKEKARGLVRKRQSQERQAAWYAQNKIQVEISKEKERKEKAERERQKEERDTRIRKAILNVAASLKEEGLAVKGPHIPGVIEHAFTLVDTKYVSPTYGHDIKINAMHNGFQWD